MVTSVEAVPEDVVTWNLLLVLPAAMVTLGGTVAALVLLLCRVTEMLPGAGPVRVTVPVDRFPPTTVAGFTLRDDSVGGLIVSVAEGALVPL